MKKNFEVCLFPRLYQTSNSNIAENAVAEQKARLFEARVSENADTIEQLRQERSMLAAEHKGLQRRFQDVTEVR